MESLTGICVPFKFSVVCIFPFCSDVICTVTWHDVTGIGSRVSLSYYNRDIYIFIEPL